jgi:hypothetical protein
VVHHKSEALYFLLQLVVIVAVVIVGVPQLPRLAAAWVRSSQRMKGWRP